MKILNIAPYLHEKPEELYKAINVKSTSQAKVGYPLNAIKEILEELKDERLLELSEQFEWEDENAEKEK